MLIPLSVVFVKYFPDIGRYYDRWTWQPHYGGVTTDKNLLGMTLFVCGLFFSCCVRFGANGKGGKARKRFLAHVILLLMTFWLLSIAEVRPPVPVFYWREPVFRDETSQCPHPCWRNGNDYRGRDSGLMLVGNFLFNLGENITGMFGRDTSFTAYGNLEAVLSQDINPLLGAGFYSFWLGDRSEHIGGNFGFISTKRITDISIPI